MYQWDLGMTAHSHSPHIPALTLDLSSHVQCGAVVVVMWCSGGRRSSFAVVVWLGISGLVDFQVQLSHVRASSVTGVWKLFTIFLCDESIAEMFAAI
jgi:hypothetical protein